MASGPITSWQIDGETMKTVRDFIFLGSKITADSDCQNVLRIVNHKLELARVPLRGEGSCVGGRAPRDSAGLGM